MTALPQASGALSRRVAAGSLPGLFDEIIIDLFAGGGGMSTGIELATGRSVDEAVNHDRDAIVMHQLNHPNTRHWHESVLAVDPLEVAAARPGGRPRPVGLLHASPDCTHFSMARGGKPVKKEIRGLAWVVCKWAAQLARHGAAPRIITMENVREFLTWGPLVQVRQGTRHGHGRLWMWEVTDASARGKLKDKKFAVDGPHKDDGSARAWRANLERLGYRVEPLLTPDKRRRGETFAIWKAHLEGLGYRVETRVLDAADYGAPTHRRRLVIVMRRDGRPIRWPEKTHGEFTSGTPGVVQGSGPRVRRKGRAIERVCVDGVGLGQASGNDGSFGDRDVHNAAARRLSSIERGDARLHQRLQLKPFRTAAECIDFSLTCPSIFGRSKDLAENTLRRIVRGLVKFVLESADPFIVQVNHGGAEFRGQHLGRPMPVISSKHGYGLVTPYFYDRYGERQGQQPRCRLVDRPMGAITGTANGANLVLPYLVQFNGERGGETRGQGLWLPLNTVPTENRFALAETAIAPWLYTNVIGQQAGRRCDLPAGVITTVHNKFNLLTPYLVRCAHGESCVSGKRWGAGERDLLLPLPTVTGSKDFAAVTPYLVEIANSGRNTGYRDATRPMATVTAKPDGGSWAAVAPLLVKYYRTGIVKPADLPLDTTTTGDRFGLAAMWLTKLRGSGGWTRLDKPIDTICAGATTFGTTAAFLAAHYGGPREVLGRTLDRPAGTITAVDHHSLVSAWVTHLKGTHGYGIGGEGLSLDTPLPTIATGNHLYLSSATMTQADLIGGPTEDAAINAGFWRVYSLLRRFLGDAAPLPFVHKRDADGNVQTYLIHDIGMRMLAPRELLNAQFGPELAKDYILTGSRESQVAKIGNSVPPYLGAAVVRANWHDAEGEVAA